MFHATKSNLTQSKVTTNVQKYALWPQNHAQKHKSSPCKDMTSIHFKTSPNSIPLYTMHHNTTPTSRHTTPCNNMPSNNHAIISPLHHAMQRQYHYTPHHAALAKSIWINQISKPNKNIPWTCEPVTPSWHHIATQPHHTIDCHAILCHTTPRHAKPRKSIPLK